CEASPSMAAGISVGIQESAAGVEMRPMARKHLYLGKMYWSMKIKQGWIMENSLCFTSHRGRKDIQLYKP
ncbi:hypothetical protein WA026_018858, partial [Henosepilachna vigintioctopunctata]